MTGGTVDDIHHNVKVPFFPHKTELFKLFQRFDNLNEPPPRRKILASHATSYARHVKRLLEVDEVVVEIPLVL